MKPRIDEKWISVLHRYRSCKHLDNKHTVFGSLVGGMEALLKMERVPTDDDDRRVSRTRIHLSLCKCSRILRSEVFTQLILHL